MSAKLTRAERLVGGPDAYLVIDDTALPKKGTLSVDVACQYCGQLGKRANCQSLVSLTLAGARCRWACGCSCRTSGPAMPSAAPGRACRRTGSWPRPKGEIALAELDRVQAAGARFGTVLADAGYDASAAFRHGLDVRGLSWAEGLQRRRAAGVSPAGRAPSLCRTGSPTPPRRCWRINPGGR